MGTLTCTIELDKKAGLTVTIENPDGKTTQTIAMDGTAITITVKGQSDTSTITQTAEKIAISCKQFEVTASETITMTSTKSSTYKSSDTLTVESSKDMTLKSSTDIDASGQNCKVTGQTTIGLTGGSTSKLDLAAASAKLSGTKVEAKGTGQVSVAGPMIEVKADATLSAESTGVATFKGSITNVQGQLVNLG